MFLMLLTVFPVGLLFPMNFKDTSFWRSPRRIQYDNSVQVTLRKEIFYHSRILPTINQFLLILPKPSIQILSTF